ncbi:MAG: hypothetical protein OHK0039_02140 [Bacteroidia bacterium]
MTPITHIRPARPEDLLAVGTLLDAAGLITSDLGPHVQLYVSYGDIGLVAVGGWGTCGEVALLRSVDIAHAWRGRGLDVAWVASLMAAAREAGIGRFYLLTTHAAGFFEKQGFQIIARSEAPPAIGQTHEFRELCPATATCMTRTTDRSSV